MPGVYKVSTRDYLIGDIDSYTHDGRRQRGSALIDPEWQAAIQNESTQPITASSRLRGAKRNVAFTVEHQLDAGEHVVHGYLPALRRPLRGETNSDFVQLFLDYGSRSSNDVLGA